MNYQEGLSLLGELYDTFGEKPDNIRLLLVIDKGVVSGLEWDGQLISNQRDALQRVTELCTDAGISFRKREPEDYSNYKIIDFRERGVNHGDI